MGPRVSSAAARRRRHRRWGTGLAAGLALVLAATGIALAAAPGDAGDPPPGYPRGSISHATGGGGGSHVVLGAGGFTVLPSPGSAWVANNPGDPRTPLIRQKITSQPNGMWITGAESYGNLSYAAAQAARTDGTLTLSLYNIPGRNDGLSDPTSTTPDAYRAFVDRVVSTLGSTRAVVVVEPDALWFADRQLGAGSQAWNDRMSLLRYVVDAFAAGAPRAAVYLEAGTSSGSVTPSRMAQLLVAAGVTQAAGFAVNVSSFAPTAAITAYAQGIRSALSAGGAGDVHYVVDTGRNGNPSWDTTWCNPAGRKLGAVPAVADGTNGLDATLWVKQPGTSDGSCGIGAGSSGGQFLPQAAYDMAS